MTVKTVRKIIRIDENLCNGCGACADKCAEGALTIIDGKARLISETYCDGLGACLNDCPKGAILIEERPADEFNEKAVGYHLAHEAREGKMACGCPGSQMLDFNEKIEVREITQKQYPYHDSALRHWPVQLTLVPTKAPFFQEADVLLTAHCVPFAYADFHHEFLKRHSLLIACPKLDDAEAHLQKLTRILIDSNIKSLTVLHMEVLCCSGLVSIAKKAIAASGKRMPFSDVTIGVKGDIKSEEQ